LVAPLVLANWRRALSEATDDARGELRALVV